MSLKVSTISHFVNFIKEDAILGFPGGSVVKNLPTMPEPQETGVQSLGQEDPLEKEMATCSSIPVWKILWTEESKGSQRISAT